MAFSDIPNETAPARLLIVEDDVLLASSLDELLSASGFEVVGIAGSAATAASLAGERHPQLASSIYDWWGQLTVSNWPVTSASNFGYQRFSYPDWQIRRRKNAPFWQSLLGSCRSRIARANFSM